jgi:DNA replication protein DnaC
MKTLALINNKGRVGKTTSAVNWHEHIGDPTLADAICDRLLHNSHRLMLQGPSRRKEEKLDS